MMIMYGIEVETDKEVYRFFVIDVSGKSKGPCVKKACTDQKKPSRTVSLNNSNCFRISALCSSSGRPIP